MTQELFDKIQSEIPLKDLTETARKLVSSLCKTGGRSWFLRIPPDPKRDPDMVFLEICRRAEYWETRCVLAEKYISETPCDPDIYPEQIKAHQEWQNFIGERTTKGA